MQKVYKPIQYFWLWIRCIFTVFATAFGMVGNISLIGDTSVGATIFGNVTAMWESSLDEVPQMNMFWSQFTFIAFISILGAGIIWAIALTIYRKIMNQNPSIFGDDLHERLDILEKKIANLEKRKKGNVHKT